VTYPSGTAADDSDMATPLKARTIVGCILILRNLIAVWLHVHRCSRSKLRLLQRSGLSLKCSRASQRRLRYLAVALFADALRGLPGPAISVADLAGRPDERTGDRPRAGRIKLEG